MLSLLIPMNLIPLHSTEAHKHIYHLYPLQDILSLIFLFWACSFCVPESINWLICKRRQQGACAWVKHWGVTHFLLPLFPFGFGHKTVTLLNLSSSQWTRAILETILEDLRTLCFLILQAFLHHFCSLVKPLFSKIIDCAGVLFHFGRGGRTTLLICCPGSWDGR